MNKEEIKANIIKLKEIINNKKLFNNCEEYKKFINDNIIYNNSDEVEFILNSEDEDKPFSYDDIENNYYIEYEEIKRDIIKDEEETKIFKEYFKEKEESFFDNFFNSKNYVNYNDELDEYLESEEGSLILGDYEREKEVFEWWIISYYLLNKLRNNEEVILDNKYWGRCCSGQNISLDSVMINIFKDITKEKLKYWEELELKFKEVKQK